jgi:hypothetical protein
MEEGEIEIDSIEQIAIQDITHQFAIESGFLGVIDLLKVVKHGTGDNVYLIRFHYVPPKEAMTKERSTQQREATAHEPKEARPRARSLQLGV